MKKWLRRTLIAAGLISLTLGGLYEYATHVGRGWLRGEAFYEGRPTSYWRLRCDEWLERFDTPKDAVGYHPPNIAFPMLDDEQIVGYAIPDPIRPRPVTLWSRCQDRFRSAQELVQDDYWPPAVLIGFPGAESVLEELAQEEPYRLLAERPLRYVKAGGAVRMDSLFNAP